MTTIVHDTTEAVCLAADYNIYLKPIAKMTVSVTLPQLKLPGKSISNWEVMERVKAMVVPDQFSTLRISKSTMDFIRFEGEVENKTVVKSLLKCLDGKSIKLSGFTDVLKVRAVENKVDFPTRHDWDSFFRDAKDMNETQPGERPDTIHLEGLPCRWFNQKQSNFPDRPSEEALIAVFEGFGKVRNVDIPMLDPYREDMLDKNFNTFSFGGHLNFEAYVQYQEYDGFTKAMDTLRGMKLMLKGDDGKAVACNIKVTFDTTKHLSDLAIKKRNLERLKLQELEKQREEQKRRKREEEERRKEQERKQKEQEEEERERKKEEKQRKRDQKLQEREDRRNLKRVRKQQEEEQKKLQMKIAMEERRLLLIQRNLESIRIIAELLARAKAVKQQQLEKERAEHEAREKQEKARQEEEVARRQQLEACRRRQQEELLRVELEKERALDLQRREKELREKLLSNMLKKSCEKPTGDPASQDQAGPAGSKEASDAARENVTLVVLGQVNGVKAAEGTSKTAAPAEIPRKSRGTKEKKGSDDVKKKREEKKKENVRSRLSEENARRRGGDRGSRRRHSSGDRRRSTSRHGTSSHRRRSDGRRSHNHCSRSASSSRDSSRSSGGRSYSRGRSRRDGHRKYSRGSSRSSSRGRDRSHYSRGYRRHSYSRDRSHSRR
ncbi:A-kinase anchor protein 17A [Nerophis lumbriciformis]|uniref:A-kinase anchor protein 17A n=1 Tax=Nerophis lumbriciformis TaxID=546530 RepID=UPI002ADF5DB6|nr:A-kinase anchor protein 17A-like [Nerophis lumbriciformis]XP_061827732.1 A-kinase anchor protein 17A-like [Nerophis lumbriciformis]XP_061827733.1 A-kinase anchor protein 17A-like [Nerophis lumbriciformis]XP_061827734.1 A-kinase anchor protein 17A-like [Nerophis lumbriciformis]XP_061827735.1 A-kinase anchor protein 17A-like [Nerophis lumbriciformis]